MATFVSCPQMKFRVELSPEIDLATRTAIERQALVEANETFLDATRRYQEIGWFGCANLAFTEARHTPSDSKTELLHALQCLKMVVLAHRQLALRAGSVRVETWLPLRRRKEITTLCSELGLQFIDDAAAARPREPIGGIYRASQKLGQSFSNQPISWMDKARITVMDRLESQRWLRRATKAFFQTLTQPLRLPSMVARLAFQFVYGAAAVRVLVHRGSMRNVFAYFPNRSGRDRDVPGYLRWKFGTDFAGADFSLIPVSHIDRPGHPYSFAAMAWAWKSLQRLRDNPAGGCIVVNYLIPPTRLAGLWIERSDLSRQLIRTLAADSEDFFRGVVHGEFTHGLAYGNGYALEVAEGYQNFVSQFPPGVVLQADAVSKGARPLTACARRNGGEAVYVSDRICTSLRTSNQFIRDAGDNPHLPTRIVAFDDVTRQEFLRQGMAEARIHRYGRDFTGTVEPGREVVLIFLQAYIDNIGAMIGIGLDIARRFPDLRVVFREHPAFPVHARAKRKLLTENDRVSFDGASGDVLAIVTGYSTAAVPGVMAGLPLIWLRRPVGNSVYGEEYLQRIGFPADDSAAVCDILARLRRSDPTTMAAVIAASSQAKEIFVPSSSGLPLTQSDAVTAAILAALGDLA